MTTTSPFSPKTPQAAKRGSVASLVDLPKKVGSLFFDARFPEKKGGSDDYGIEQRFAANFRDQHEKADRSIARLIIGEGVLAIVWAVAAHWVPWVKAHADSHLGIIATLLIACAVGIYPAWLGLKKAGEEPTRHAVAAGQILMVTLLMQLAMGRFGSLVLLYGSIVVISVYRDPRVLWTAAGAAAAGHFVLWLSLADGALGGLFIHPLQGGERMFWVVFEVGAIVLTIRSGGKELEQVVSRQARLEVMNRLREMEIQSRTTELAESEERFRTLFQDSPIGLFRLHSNGSLAISNPAMLAIFGFANTEEMRAHQASFEDMNDPIFGREFLAELSAGSNVQGRQVTWKRKNGESIHVRVTARAFHGLHGEVINDAGAVEDITERRQLEERYLQAQKVQAIGQLAGGVAHDFNNLLTAIYGYSEVLLQNNSLSDSARKYVNEICRATDRASSLTQQLLAFSRKQTLQPKVMRLDSIVTDLEKMVQRLIGEHIELRTIAEPDVSSVKADPGQIQQVILNLVVNARDAMPRGGLLTIKTSNVSLDLDYAQTHPGIAPGDYVMLAVSDTGIGMTAEVKARLFEPFFTTKAPGSGTGLGLATCDGIIKQSGGHITVQTEVGRGTTFRIYLPSAAGEKESASAEPFVQRRGDGEAVLLVEDEEMVRDLGGIVLTSLGYRVILASNGRDALKKLAEHRDIELLITDVVMPDMGGKELARRVKLVAPELRVLFTSGYAFDAVARQDFSEDGFHFLAKPYTGQQLSGKVRELLRPAPAKATLV